MKFGKWEADMNKLIKELEHKSIAFNPDELDSSFITLDKNISHGQTDYFKEVFNAMSAINKIRIAYNINRLKKEGVVLVNLEQVFQMPEFYKDDTLSALDIIPYMISYELTKGDMNFLNFGEFKLIREPLKKGNVWIFMFRRGDKEYAVSFNVDQDFKEFEFKLKWAADSKYVEAAKHKFSALTHNPRLGIINDPEFMDALRMIKNKSPDHVFYAVQITPDEYSSILSPKKRKILTASEWQEIEKRDSIIIFNRKAIEEIRCPELDYFSMNRFCEMIIFHEKVHEVIMNLPEGKLGNLKDIFDSIGYLREVFDGVKEIIPVGHLADLSNIEIIVTELIANAFGFMEYPDTVNGGHEKITAEKVLSLFNDKRALELRYYIDELKIFETAKDLTQLILNEDEMHLMETKSKELIARFIRHRFKNFKQLIRSFCYNLKRSGGKYDADLAKLCDGYTEKIEKIISNNDVVYTDDEYIKSMLSGVEKFISEFDPIIDEKIDNLLKKEDIQREDAETIELLKGHFKPRKEEMNSFLRVFPLNTNDIKKVINSYKNEMIAGEGYSNFCKWEFSEEPLIFDKRHKNEEVILMYILDEFIQNAYKAAGNKPIKFIIKLSKEDKNIKIEVSDTGPGIPIEILPRIFDEFFTTRESGEGGEGLYLAKRYVVNFKSGSIEINTKIAEVKAYKLTCDINGVNISENSARNDTGSTFTIRIPLSISEIEQIDGLDKIREPRDTKEQIDTSI